MIKINFPVDIDKRKALEKRFYKSMFTIMDEEQINNLIIGATYKGETLDLKKILTASFDDLNGVFKAIEIYFAGNAAGYDTFKAKFNYSDCRHLLYNFFIAEDINNHIDLGSCYYCNIDFINAYDDRGGYLNKVDFLNRATQEELNNITGIADGTSAKIIAQRAITPITDLSLNFLSKGKRGSILSFKLMDQKGVFTLDHFYRQSLFKVLSTSLYNLIPSCAPCNSRFKHTADFQIGINITYMSPSSANYVLGEYQVFGLLFRPGKNIGNVKSVNDIYLTYNDYLFGQEEFLDLFNIPARYSFHKKEAVKLILKFQRYPKSNIDEIERSLKYAVDRQTIIKDLFGADIFDENSNQPLSKLRRDIALQIGLIE